MQAMGQLGLGARGPRDLQRLARLYWYTVEFGLAREEGALRIYGAGILSSFGESLYALDSAKPHRLAFDMERVLRTPYRTDAFQQSYFVVDRFEDVLRLVEGDAFTSLCRELDGPAGHHSALSGAERLAA
jgi:phenylalanine-4-hydroxylase